MLMKTIMIWLEDQKILKVKHKLLEKINQFILMCLKTIIKKLLMIILIKK